MRQKSVFEMSKQELRHALLTSDKTGMPNRRAFNEAQRWPWIAICDINGLKKFNDQFSYAAGDILIRKFAGFLKRVGLEAYHDKGDEFICQGKSVEELKTKLAQAKILLQQHVFHVCAIDGTRQEIRRSDFCYGVGRSLNAAERALKRSKKRARSTRLLVRS